MTATAFAAEVTHHATDEIDYELLAAIDPQSLPQRLPQPRVHLTLLEGGRADQAARRRPGVAPAQARLSQRESEMVEVYRRRRFLAALAVTVIAVVAVWASGLSLTSMGVAAPTAVDGAPTVHVVGLGDTYPSIAAELGADDPNDFADTLRAANGGAELAPGQRLFIQIG